MPSDAGESGGDDRFIPHGGSSSRGSSREFSPRRQGEKRAKPAEGVHLLANDPAVELRPPPPPPLKLELSAECDPVSPPQKRCSNGHKRQDSRLSPLTAKRQGSLDRLCAPAAGHSSPGSVAGVGGNDNAEGGFRRGIPSVASSGSLHDSVADRNSNGNGRSAGALRTSGSSSDISSVGRSDDEDDCEGWGGGDPAGSQQESELDAPLPVRTRATKGPRWTSDEDAQLKVVVAQNGARNWKLVAELLGSNRTSVQCLHRWNKVVKPGICKGPWTEEEDQAVRESVEAAGVASVRWSTVAERLPGRIGKQCRERWFNHLDPTVRKEKWTPEEDAIVFHSQQRLGNRWSEIARFLPGRTENAVKNRFNSAARRRWLEGGAAQSEPPPGLLQRIESVRDLAIDTDTNSEHAGGGGYVRRQHRRQLSGTQSESSTPVSPAQDRRPATANPGTSAPGSNPALWMAPGQLPPLAPAAHKSEQQQQQRADEECRQRLVLAAAEAAAAAAVQGQPMPAEALAMLGATSVVKNAVTAAAAAVAPAPPGVTNVCMQPPQQQQVQQQVKPEPPLMNFFAMAEMLAGDQGAAVASPAGMTAVAAPAPLVAAAPVSSAAPMQTLARGFISTTTPVEISAPPTHPGHRRALSGADRVTVQLELGLGHRRVMSAADLSAMGAAGPQQGVARSPSKMVLHQQQQVQQQQQFQQPSQLGTPGAAGGSPAPAPHGGTTAPVGAYQQPQFASPEVMQLVHHQQQQQLKLAHEQQAQQLHQLQQQQTQAVTVAAQQAQTVPRQVPALAPGTQLHQQQASQLLYINAAPTPPPAPMAANSPQQAAHSTPIYTFTAQGAPQAGAPAPAPSPLPMAPAPVQQPQPPPPPLQTTSPPQAPYGAQALNAAPLSLLSSPSSRGSACSASSLSVQAPDSPVSQAVRQTRRTLPAMQPNELVPMQMLPYYKYLNEDAQRSIMRQLIDQFQRTTVSDTQSPAAQNQQATASAGPSVPAQFGQQQQQQQQPGAFAPSPQTSLPVSPQAQAPSFQQQQVQVHLLQQHRQQQLGVPQVPAPASAVSFVGSPQGGVAGPLSPHQPAASQQGQQQVQLHAQQQALQMQAAQQHYQQQAQLQAQLQAQRQQQQQQQQHQQAQLAAQQQHAVAQLQAQQQQQQQQAQAAAAAAQQQAAAHQQALQQQQLQAQQQAAVLLQPQQQQQQQHEQLHQALQRHLSSVQSAFDGHVDRSVFAQVPMPPTAAAPVPGQQQQQAQHLQQQSLAPPPASHVLSPQQQQQPLAPSQPLSAHVTPVQQQQREQQQRVSLAADAQAQQLNLLEADQQELRQVLLSLVPRRESPLHAPSAPETVPMCLDLGHQEPLALATQMSHVRTLDATTAAPAPPTDAAPSLTPLQFSVPVVESRERGSTMDLDAEALPAIALAPAQPLPRPAIVTPAGNSAEPSLQACAEKDGRPLFSLSRGASGNLTLHMQPSTSSSHLAAAGQPHGNGAAVAAPTPAPAAPQVQAPAAPDGNAASASVQIPQLMPLLSVTAEELMTEELVSTPGTASRLLSAIAAAGASIDGRGRVGSETPGFNRDYAMSIDQTEPEADAATAAAGSGGHSGEEAAAPADDAAGTSGSAAMDVMFVSSPFNTSNGGDCSGSAVDMYREILLGGQQSPLPLSGVSGGLGGASGSGGVPFVTGEV